VIFLLLKTHYKNYDIIIFSFITTSEFLRNGKTFYILKPLFCNDRE